MTVSLRVCRTCSRLAVRASPALHGGTGCRSHRRSINLMIEFFIYTRCYAGRRAEQMNGFLSVHRTSSIGQISRTGCVFLFLQKSQWPCQPVTRVSVLFIQLHILEAVYRACPRGLNSIRRNRKTPGLSNNHGGQL